MSLASHGSELGLALRLGRRSGWRSGRGEGSVSKLTLQVTAKKRRADGQFGAGRSPPVCVLLKTGQPPWRIRRGASESIPNAAKGPETSQEGLCLTIDEAMARGGSKSCRVTGAAARTAGLIVGGFEIVGPFRSLRHLGRSGAPNVRHHDAGRAKHQGERHDSWRKSSFIEPSAVITPRTGAS